MFSGLQPFDGKAGPRSWLRRHRTVAVSVGAHLTALAVIVFHGPRVIDLTPTWLSYGDSDHTYHVTYIPTGNQEKPPDEAKLTLPRKPQPAPAQLRPQMQKPKPVEPPRPPEPNSEQGSLNSKAGSPLGTVVDGPIVGHEVHIALPVYPEPQVDRANLPHDLVGDVVIEVTIDSEGNVVETKVVKSIGHDIDERIEATLRRRHYQPATLDGAPVASHQDVHLHFPS